MTRPPRKRQYANTERLRTVITSTMERQGLADARAVARVSKGSVSYSALFNILKGITRSVRHETLQDLATVLHIEVLALVDAARDSAGEPWVWPDRFDQYPVHLRASVEALVDSQLLAITEYRES